MTKKIELAKIPVGKSIKVFGKSFTVLEHTDGGTLVLSESIETNMPFRDKCEARVAPNDFRDSDICQYLNREYLAELTNGTDNMDAIIDMEIDLKCTLGQQEYGKCTTKIGLLTLDQYGKYYDIIPKVNDCWWLATPYGTPLCSPNTYYTDHVWYVYKSSGYDNLCRNYSYGVRPALVLDSSLLVSCDDILDDDTTSLSDFSDEELLEEIKSRL